MGQGQVESQGQRVGVRARVRVGVRVLGLGLRLDERGNASVSFAVCAFVDVREDRGHLVGVRV